MLFALSMARAESSDVVDTTGSKQRKSGEQKESMKQTQGERPGGMMQQKLKGFVDEDGDGIDDRLQRMKGMQQGQMKDMMHDRFIDLDGDGINDDRCGGMGIARPKGKSPRGMHR